MQCVDMEHVVIHGCWLKLQVVGLAIFLALILRPVAVEDNQEVEILLDGRN